MKSNTYTDEARFTVQVGPKYLDLSIGTTVAPGTISYSLRNMVCHEQMRTPPVGKKELANMNFPSLASLPNGSGDIFYTLLQNGMSTINQKEIISLIKMHEDTKYVFSPNISIPDLYYRTEVDRILVKCDEHKVAIRWSDYYDISNSLVFLSGADPSKEVVWQEFKEQSPYALLQRIVCKPNEAQK